MKYVPVEALENMRDCLGELELMLTGSAGMLGPMRRALEGFIASALDAVPVAELQKLPEKWNAIRLAMHEAGHQGTADAYRECEADLHYVCSDPPPATLRTGREP